METAVRYEANIRTLREAQDISIRKLSELADVNRGYLSWAERGRFNLTQDEIRRVATVLREPIRLSVITEYYPEDSTA